MDADAPRLADQARPGTEAGEPAPRAAAASSRMVAAAAAAAQAAHQDDGASARAVAAWGRLVPAAAAVAGVEVPKACRGCGQWMRPKETWEETVRCLICQRHFSAVDRCTCCALAVHWPVCFDAHCPVRGAHAADSAQLGRAAERAGVQQPQNTPGSAGARRRRWACAAEFLPPSDRLSLGAASPNLRAWTGCTGAEWDRCSENLWKNWLQPLMRGEEGQTTSDWTRRLPVHPRATPSNASLLRAVRLEWMYVHRNSRISLRSISGTWHQLDRKRDASRGLPGLLMSVNAIKDVVFGYALIPPDQVILADKRTCRRFLDESLPVGAYLWLCGGKLPSPVRLLPEFELEIMLASPNLFGRAGV